MTPVKSILAVVCFMGFWISSTVEAQNVAPTSGKIQVGHQTITLPPGSWQMVGEATRSASVSGGGGTSSVKIEDKIFIQVEQGRVTKLMWISSNDVPTAWSRATICGRQDVYLNASKENGQERECMVVNHIVQAQAPGPTTNAAYRSAYAAAKAYGGIPHTMISASYYLTNMRNFLSVDVRFNPVPEGFPEILEPWSTSPWHRDRATADRKAYLAKISAWADGYRAVLKRDFE